MIRNAILVSAAAASVLLTSAPSFALIPLGTVEPYYVQDGHNGVIPSRRTGNDEIFAVEREDRSAIRSDMAQARMRTDMIWFPERVKSGRN